MGKAARFACIFTPMALTLASLVCLCLVFAGNMQEKNSITQAYYFLKLDASEFDTTNPQVTDLLPDNDNIDNNLFESLQLDGFQASANAGNIEDYYTIGLWNYCSGKYDTEDKSAETSYDSCSDPKANFYFNPIELWKLEGTTAQQAFPEEMENGLETYKKAVKWMFAAYIIAFCLTVAEIVCGIFAVCSRWGSFVTTIVSIAQTVFMIGAAASSTAIFTTLAGVFHTVLEPLNVHATLGRQMFIAVWLGTAFSIASGFFWLISTCCCSGKSSNSKKVSVEKTPYTYERVASPYSGAAPGGGSQHQLGPMPPASGHGNSGSAYEPFRAQSHV